MSVIKKAIILAGGEGTRLRPVTFEIPKPLVPVKGAPIASWLVKMFAKHGVEDVTVIYPTKWKENFMQWANEANNSSALGPRSEVKLFEEKEPMGTMGAMVHEMDLGEEPLFVTNGDELKDLDLDQLIEFHNNLKAEDPRHAATVALVKVPNPSEYGVAEMAGPRIMRFHEKPAVPPSTMISSGLYVIEPDVFDELGTLSDTPVPKFLMFEKDLFPRLATEGRLGGCPLEGAWFDCGTLERWEKAIKEWEE